MADVDPAEHTFSCQAQTAYSFLFQTVLNTDSFMISTVGRTTSTSATEHADDEEVKLRQPQDHDSYANSQSNV